jgi:hypothetical protein
MTTTRTFTHGLFSKSVKFIIILLFTYAHVQAQDFEFGQLLESDKNLKFYANDPGSGAVILQESGTLTFSKSYAHNTLHQYHVKIKIFKQDAVKYGDVKIPLYKWNNGSAERITRFEAVIQTPDASGSFKKTVCDIKGALYTKLSKNGSMFSYALPNITAGSIVEYLYEIETPSSNDFTPWLFQKDIPNLHSEYQVHNPLTKSIDAILKGSQELTKAISSEKCTIHPELRCLKQIYEMDSIPAFKPEERMTDPSYYLSALYFKTPDYVYNKDNTKTLVQYWSDVDKGLNKSEFFGKQIIETNRFKKNLKGLVPDIVDTLTQAKAIYNFLNHHVKWDEKATFFSADGINKCFKNRKGSSGDINLMLIAALRAYKINVEPLLISTKNNGIITKNIPSFSAFNYVIAKAYINKQTYYLDATDPMLPFGMVPEYCINDEARLVSQQDSCYWTSVIPSYKKGYILILNLTLNDDAQINGTIKNYTVGYDGLLKRKLIKQYNTIEEYEENLKNAKNNFKIHSVKVDDLDSVNTYLSETYNIDIPLPKYNSADKLTFNPYLINAITENPFKTAERIYPIDCGIPSEIRLLLNLNIPANYQVQNLPKNISLVLPDNGGSFSASYGYTDNMLNLSQTIRLNKPVYSPDEYLDLRELFNKIIQVQKEDIILKRKP